jgi:uncharacterized membrane protein
MMLTPAAVDAHVALDWATYVALAIETLAVAIIAVGIAASTVAYISQRRGHAFVPDDTERYRARLGTTLLLGLEVLIAGDIVRTVALEPTIANLLVLGLLVVIRTFLSWSLVVEIEGAWPWQLRAQPRPEASQSAEPAAGPSHPDSSPAATRSSLWRTPTV